MAQTRPAIRKLFLDTHMGLGHFGLGQLARKAKVDLAKLEDGDLLLFMNKKGDKLKVLGAQGRVIGYLKMPSSQPIMKEALQYLPKTFGGDHFDYDKACEIALKKRLGLTSADGNLH